MALAPRVNVLLVCGGKYHDFDYARLELLKLLAEHSRLRVRVVEDYSTIAALDGADMLITYTCNVLPDAAGQSALQRFLERGVHHQVRHPIQ